MAATAIICFITGRSEQVRTFRKIARSNISKMHSWVAVSATIILVLTGCATPREMMGWEANVPFELTPSEVQASRADTPVISGTFPSVEFLRNGVCLSCGDVSDTNGIGFGRIEWRVSAQQFGKLVMTELQKANLFSNQAGKPWSLRMTLLTLDQQSSVGAAAERRSVMTSGAVLTTTVSVQYDLSEGGQLRNSWKVTTKATSNSLAASTRLSENIEGALKRNARVFLLEMRGTYQPESMPRARQLIAAIGGEVDDKRIGLGSVVYGATKVVTTVGGAVGTGLEVVAKNSGAISQSLNATAGEMARINRNTQKSIYEANARNSMSASTGNQTASDRDLSNARIKSKSAANSRASSPPGNENIAEGSLYAGSKLSNTNKSRETGNALSVAGIQASAGASKLFDYGQCATSQVRETMQLVNKEASAQNWTKIATSTQDRGLGRCESREEVTQRVRAAGQRKVAERSGKVIEERILCDLGGGYTAARYGWTCDMWGRVTRPNGKFELSFSSGDR